MKKFIAIVFLLLFLPVTAHAHSGLSSSMPAEGATLEGSPEEIQFQFDSPIQQGTMVLKDEAGNAITISEISFSETELSGQLNEELPNGAYTVDWSAISQDSHEVTGTLTFNIAAEEAEETTEEATEEPASEEATETTEQSEEADVSSNEQPEEASAPATEPATAEAPWVTIIIIAILAIAAVTFFVMARRK